MTSKNDEVGRSSSNAMLKVGEVAMRYNIGTRTVWRWVSAGHIPQPIYVAPRSPRWDPAEVEQAINRHRRQR